MVLRLDIFQLPVGFSRGILCPPSCLSWCRILSRLLSRAEASGTISGIKLHSSAPTISHLFFADDILFFGKASCGEVACFKECLDTYSTWSGQVLSQHKSAIHFSSNVSPQSALFLADLIGMKRLPIKQRHLGLPLIFPSARSSVLDDLRDRILAKIFGWQVKLLSQAGRSFLIAAVAPALPSYGMSSLLFPMEWCRMMDSHFKNFWWGFDPQKS